MRQFTLALVAAALTMTLLAGCESKPKVRATFRPEAEFAAYKHYTWSESIIRTTDSWLDKQNLDAMLRKMVSERLAAKGYKLVGTSLQEPDFLVQYEADQFNDGSLTLRVIDTKLRRVVWTATIDAVIQQPTEKPEARTAALDKATTELLTQFPPPSSTVPLPEPVRIEPGVKTAAKPAEPTTPEVVKTPEPETTPAPKPEPEPAKPDDANPAPPKADDAKPDTAKPDEPKKDDAPATDAKDPASDAKP